jgi:uncharacterized protein YcfL
MKYLLILSIVLLLLSGCRSANQQELSDRNDDQVINSIEERWAQAELERKVDFFEQTLADDYVYTAPDGSYFTKSQVLNKTKKVTRRNYWHFFKSGRCQSTNLRIDCGGDWDGCSENPD